METGRYLPKESILGPKHGPCDGAVTKEIAMRRYLRWAALVGLACAVLGAARPGRAAVEGPKTSAIFVKIDGIAGSSADEQHKGQIEALSFNWSAKQKEGKDGGGGPDLHDALLLKPVDAATPRIMLALAKGETIPEVTVDVRGTVAGGKAQQVYLQYVFTGVKLTVVSHAVVNSAQEQVQFSYKTVRIRYVGADGQAVEEGWDA